MTHNFSSIVLSVVQQRISRYDGNENENIYALFLGNDFSRIDDIRRREAGTPLEPRCFQTIPFHVRGLIKQRSLRTHRGWFSLLPRGSTRVTPVRFTFGGNLCFRQRRKTARIGQLHRGGIPHAAGAKRGGIRERGRSRQRYKGFC